MNAQASPNPGTANRVGITGLSRRLVLDGSFGSVADTR